MADVIKFEDATRAFERDKEIIKRRIAGQSERRIAEEMGLTAGEVRAAHVRMMGSVPPDFRARQLQLEGERLEALHEIFWPIAEAGDIDAGKLVATTIRERCKLYGFYPLPTREDSLEGLKNNETSTEMILRKIREVQGKAPPVIDGEATHVDEDEDDEPDGAA